MQPSGKRWAEFSSYKFDFAAGELTRFGSRVRLETQPARVLELLLLANGDLVPRRNLIVALWPGETQGDFDRRLDKAVAKLRASLSDDPIKPKFVETLKGRGYRFLAPVTFQQNDCAPEEMEQRPAEGAKVPDSSPPSPFSNRKRQPIYSFPTNPAGRLAVLRNGAAIVFCLLLAAWAIARWRPSIFAQHAHQTPTVVILGFRDLSKTPESAWLSGSVVDWLSSDLKADNKLQVVEGVESPVLRERSGASGCGELPERAQNAARVSFNADFAVYGDFSVTEPMDSGERWRLDICMQRLNEPRPVESMTIIGPAGDISQMAFDAGQSIRSKIGLTPLSNQSIGYLRATLPTNLAAARLYSEGSSALRGFRPEEASVLLTEAARLEPRHAATHAALSAAWAELGYQEKSRQEARTARDLAKNLSPDQQLEYEGLVEETAPDWQAAANVYTKLLELHPDSSDYATKLAYALTREHKGTIALQVLAAYRLRNRAAENDPRVDLADASAKASTGDYRAQLAAASKAEREAGAQSYDLLLADARMEEGDSNDKLDNWNEASSQWRLAEQSYEAIGNRKGMASALMRLGDLAWRRDQAVNADRLFEEALGLSRTIGDQHGVADALSRLGVLRIYTTAVRSSNAAPATEFFKQAATIYKETGDLAEAGNVMSLFGDEALARCHYKQARAFYVQAMELSKAAGDKSRIANRLLDLGIVAETEGHLPVAEQYFRQSLSMYRDLGQQDRAAVVSERIGEVTYRQGKVDEAAQTFENSLAELRSIGRTMQVLQVRGQLVRLDLLRNPVRAELLARENVREAQTTSKTDPNGMAALYAQLARAEANLDKLKEAKDALRRSLASGEHALHQDFLPQILIDRGYVYMDGHEYATAAAQFFRAKELAHREGQIYWELNARLALGETYSLERGKPAVPELARLKDDASKSGFGIFPAQIDAFLKRTRL